MYIVHCIPDPYQPIPLIYIQKMTYHQPQAQECVQNPQHSSREPQAHFFPSCMAVLNHPVGQFFLIGCIITYDGQTLPLFSNNIGEYVCFT